MVPEQLTRSDLLKEIRTRVTYIAEDRRKEVLRLIIHIVIVWAIFILMNSSGKWSNMLMMMSYTVVVVITTLAMSAMYNFVKLLREEFALISLLHIHEIIPIDSLDENDNLLAKSLYLANLGRVYKKKLQTRKRK